MTRCRILGHQFRFTAQGQVMSWSCARGCGAGGSKAYPTAAHARRYAAAFDQEDTGSLGERAPLIGLLPLRLVRLVKRLRAGRAESG